MDTLQIDFLYSGKINLIQQGKDDTKPTKTKVYIKIFKAVDGKHVIIYKDAMFRNSFGFFNTKNCIINHDVNNLKVIKICLNRSNATGLQFEADTIDAALFWISMIRTNITPTSSPCTFRGLRLSTLCIDD